MSADNPTQSDLDANDARIAALEAEDPDAERSKRVAVVRAAGFVPYGTHGWWHKPPSGPSMSLGEAYMRATTPQPEPMPKRSASPAEGDDAYSAVAAAQWGPT